MEQRHDTDADAGHGGGDPCHRTRPDRGSTDTVIDAAEAGHPVAGRLRRIGTHAVVRHAVECPVAASREVARATLAVVITLYQDVPSRVMS